MGNFTFSDGWLLVSIIYCGKKGGRLKDIISIGDMLNHDVISLEELNSGINKLLANGYIMIETKKFRATEKSLEFYQNNKVAGEGCIAEMIRIAKLFNELPCDFYGGKVYIPEEEYKRSFGLFYSIFHRERH